MPLGLVAAPANGSDFGVAVERPRRIVVDPHGARPVAACVEGRAMDRRTSWTVDPRAGGPATRAARAAGVERRMLLEIRHGRRAHEREMGDGSSGRARPEDGLDGSTRCRIVERAVRRRGRAQLQAIVELYRPVPAADRQCDCRPGTQWRGPLMQPGSRAAGEEIFSPRWAN